MKTQPKFTTGVALALAGLAVGLLPSQQAYGDSFTPTGSLGAARTKHSATLLANGEVLVVAGHDAAYSLISCELYKPSTGTWVPTGQLSMGRYLHSATLLSNGKVLVVGGDHAVNSPTATCELYDPATGTWTKTGSLITARFSHTATLLNGKVLVAGGRTFLGHALSTAELYDPTTQEWTAAASMSTERAEHQAVLLPSGKLLVAGGANLAGAVLSSSETYDPQSGDWTSTGAMAAHRHRYSATLLANGQVLVAGGMPTTNDFVVTNLSSAELYDPAVGTWRSTGAMRGPRAVHRATLLPNGQLLVSGGFDKGDGISLDTAELYNPDSGNWTSAAPMSGARERHTATLLPNGNVLYAAGWAWTGSTTCLDSAGLYDSAPRPIVLLNLPKQPRGQFQFAFSSAANGANTVLTTTNPALPVANWTDLGLVPEFAPGLYLFSDSQATNGPQRFYCVRSQ